DSTNDLDLPFRLCLKPEKTGRHRYGELLGEHRVNSWERREFISVIGNDQIFSACLCLCGIRREDSEEATGESSLPGTRQVNVTILAVCKEAPAIATFGQIEMK